MKMNISEKLVKKHTNKIIYQRGEEDYKAGKVTELEVKDYYYKEEAFYVYEIFAVVEAAYYDEYYIEIIVSEKTGFISVDCDCPFFNDNHRKMGFCKHIVAVMLKFIKEYYSKSHFNEEGNKLNKLLRDIKYNAYKLSDQKEKLKLEINYFYDIYDYIPSFEEIKDFSDLYFSEDFKKIKIYNYSHVKSGVRVSGQGLLEFDFRIEDIDPKEIRKILSSIRQKKKYYRLKDGDLIDLQHQDFSKVASVIDYLNINEKELFSKGRTLIPKYNAFYLDEALGDDLQGFKKDLSFKKFIKDLEEEKNIDYSLPPNLDNIMRNYQKEGFKWLKNLSHYGFGGILADEMGLGKTLQTIAFIAAEKADKPSLIVAPTTLIYNWLREVEKFAPQLKALVIAGSPQEREDLIANAKDYDMVITSYPLIRRDVESYKDITFKYCILDEAQHIKNPLSQNSYAVKSIKAKGYFALTGTPLENSLTELWSIFDFIMPGYLFNHHKFLERYEIPIVKEGDQEVLATLNKHIKPFILRRLKKDVVAELPPKIEHKLVVDMTEEQKKLYTAYMLSARKTVERDFLLPGQKGNKLEIMALLTRLRQICCDPAVFLEDYQGDSGKMQALEELLGEVLAQKHRVLLFSQFTRVLKNIVGRLKSKGIPYSYLDGNTPAKVRNDLVNDFNAGSNDIFLISLKAGGTGLNLTGADIVIHFDPWWNPAVEQQATDRAHRIGQEKTVQVIKLIAKDTIEEKIYNLQEKKKEIFDKVVEVSTSEMSLISKLSEAEIRELFIS
jgi:SNF2 family DNA or RNA helicase